MSDTVLAQAAKWHEMQARLINSHAEFMPKDLQTSLVIDAEMHTLFAKAIREADSDEPREVSACCFARMEVRGTLGAHRREGTNYYVCSHCQRACDPKETTTTKEP